MNATSIANLLLSGLIILSAALAVRAIAGTRVSAAVRHLILVSGFFALLLLPLGNAVLSFLPAPVYKIRSRVVLFVTPDQPGIRKATSPDSGPIPVAEIAGAIWLLGVAALIIRATAGIHRLSRRTAPARWAVPALHDLRQSLGIKRHVGIFESASGAGPATYGIFRPAILLPASAREWDSDRLRLVLLHELMHVARFDWAIGALAELAAALHWFNPLAWYGLKLLAREREIACDDAVLGRGADRFDYAGHLVEIAAAAGCREISASITMAHASGLETRVRSILNSGIKRGGTSMKGKVAAAITAGLAVVLLSAMQAPAQGGAALSGTVQDPSGAYVANAVVLLRNTANNKREMVHSDPAGQFRLTDVPPGKYGLEVTKPGFQLFRIGDIELSGGSAQQVAVMLQLGRISETLSVAGTRPSGTTPAAQNSGGVPTRLRIGGNVQAAKVVKQVRPVYPTSMKEQGMEGSVLLDAVIGSDGRVLSLQPANTQVHPDFVQSAMDAVRLWEYEPTLLNGNPVEVATSITINYTLAP